MRFSHRILSTIALALLSLGARAALVRAETPADGVVVLTRGPVHEAYAAPSNTELLPGYVAPREPPDPIPELPPDQKPEGDNVQWLPGYWSWDQDQKDFLWVSGFWRTPPPDRRWVAGHWTQTENGWQWVPGFWAAAEQERIDYLAAPPATLDNGPTIESPGDDSFYVSGTWVPRQSRYLWRPGYWQAYRPGWVWEQARYYWTPAGYAFCEGYWDYALEDRGLLFAPVYFNRPYWNDPGWCYRPHYGIRPLGLLASLFLRPRYNSYYFGDYYDPAYGRLGFQPWFTFGTRHYDPLFSYYRWHNRNDPRWFSGLGDTFIARRDGTLARPPRTLVQQNTLLNGGTIAAAQRGALQLAAPLNQFRNENVRLTRLTAAQVQQQRAAADQLRALSAARLRAEKPSGAATTRRSPGSRSATPITQFALPPSGRQTANTNASRSHIGSLNQPTQPAHSVDRIQTPQRDVTTPPQRSFNHSQTLPRQQDRHVQPPTRSDTGRSRRHESAATPSATSTLHAPSARPQRQSATTQHQPRTEHRSAQPQHSRATPSAQPRAQPSPRPETRAKPAPAHQPSHSQSSSGGGKQSDHHKK